jgi:hypothetical protein
MEKKHLRMIVLQDAEMICKHLCLLQTLTLLALLFEFCNWLNPPAYTGFLPGGRGVARPGGSW